jgi:hypothetical protein
MVRGGYKFFSLVVICRYVRNMLHRYDYFHLLSLDCKIFLVSSLVNPFWAKSCLYACLLWAYFYIDTRLDVFLGKKKHIRKEHVWTLRGKYDLISRFFDAMVKKRLLFHENQNTNLFYSYNIRSVV